MRQHRGRSRQGAGGDERDARHRADPHAQQRPGRRRPERPGVQVEPADQRGATFKPVAIARERAGTAAGIRKRFAQRNLGAALGQRQRGGNATKACAYDDSIEHHAAPCH